MKVEALIKRLKDKQAETGRDALLNPQNTEKLWKASGLYTAYELALQEIAAMLEADKQAEKSK